MENLIARTIDVSKPMTVVYPQFHATETLDMVAVCCTKFERKYASNNGIVCFVHEGHAYVMPYTRHGMNTLKENGFEEDYFFVPFSNWDYPVVQKGRWEKLQAEAEESYLLDFETDALEWSEGHGFGCLSDEVLSHCMRIPRGGIRTIHYFSKEEYLTEPFCGNEKFFGYEQSKLIGRWCYNNGKISFVYRDGHSYVAKWKEEIERALVEAGYQRDDLFVPFSNGERILDPVLAEKWEKM